MKLNQLLILVMLSVSLVSCVTSGKKEKNEGILPKIEVLDNRIYWCFTEEDTEIFLKEAYR